MTDVQLLTLAVAVIVPLSLLLYSNSRITDVNGRIADTKETLRAEMKSMHTELSAEIQALRSEMRAMHAEILATLERIAAQVKALETNLENKLKIHELEHHR